MARRRAAAGVGRWSRFSGFAVLALSVALASNLGIAMAHERTLGERLHDVVSHLGEHGRDTARKQSLDEVDAGVSDKDMSPTLPPEFVKEEADFGKQFKEMKKRAEKDDETEIRLSSKIKSMETYVQDETVNVHGLVMKMNRADTDKIDAIVPTVGPAGPPGPTGQTGFDGIEGPQGPQGSQGATGPSGIPGVMGGEGKDGPLGPKGDTGKEGLSGIQGVTGLPGEEGPPGPYGPTDEWKFAHYDCPGMATPTMRMTKCEKNGCLLEVAFEDEWGSVCDEGFSEQTADHVCGMFGFSGGGKAFPKRGGGAGMVWLSQVKCTGFEGDIGDCDHPEWGVNKCGHGQDVGLCCFGDRSGKVGVRTGPSYFPRAPGADMKADHDLAEAEKKGAEGGSPLAGLAAQLLGAGATKSERKAEDAMQPNYLRLVDCSRFACRLEVFHNDKWGTICDKGFTEKTADTLCKSMGFPGGGHSRRGCATETKYGNCAPNDGGKGAIWLEDVNCLGFERGIEGCEHGKWADTMCRHDNDVGLFCNGKRSPVTRQPTPGEDVLSYSLSNGFKSTTGGPVLVTPWGAGKTKGTDGYKFKDGQGLAFDPSPYISPVQYTVLVRFQLQKTSGGYRQIFSSSGWGESGLYVQNEKLQIYPDAGVSCLEPIMPQMWYTAIMTRSLDGTVKVYLNGYLCGSGRPREHNHYALNPHEITLFHGPGQDQASGYVRDIKVYNHTLTEEQVKAAARCRTNSVGKSCPHTISFSSSAARTHYSSVWGGDVSGHGHASGRLNSKQAWSAQESKIGEWMQLDSGAVQSIIGVTTQGRRDMDQWVTGFKVQVSADGNAWVDAFCGQYFKGNSNRNAKVRTIFPEPILSRYVRILPYTWFGHMSMRAGVIVCEKPCVGGELSFKFRMDFLSSTFGPAMDPYWGEGDFDTEHGPYNFNGGKGMLLEGSRCVGSGKQYTIILDVLLDHVDGVWNRLLGSKGWGDTGLYVNTNLRLSPSAINMRCKEVLLPGRYYKYVMTRDVKGEVSIFVNGEVCATGTPDISDHFALDPTEIVLFHDDGGRNGDGKVRSVRIFNQRLEDKKIALICDCLLPEKGKACGNFISYSPPYQMSKYSSIWASDQPGTGHGRSRLNSGQAWSAGQNTVGEYVQMDVGEVTSIAGVVTQGRHDLDQWVTAFTVEVSQDGISWYSVHCGRVFEANKDRSTKVKTIFDYPARARYVRVIPQTWLGHMSMRVGVLLCERPCVDGVLDYGFKMSFLSRTKGPSLNPYWGEGLFLGPSGPYQFAAGQGLKVAHGRCVKANTYSLLLEVSLDKTDGWRRLLQSDGWGDNGLYVNTNYQLFPASSNVRCQEKIIAGKKYKLGMTRTGDGVVSLFLHGGLCASGSPLFSNKFELNPKELAFFRDDGSENSGGLVSRIRVWEKALSHEEMATVSGCTLATLGKKCDRNIIVSPPDYKTSYSSVYSNSPVGEAYGRGRLRSDQGWSCAGTDPAALKAGSEYMQIDTGEIQSIAGVVTQGRADYDQWVTSFKASASEDGITWVDVQCGRVFDGNTDRDTKVKNRFDEPVRAQYLRIYPESWSGWMSMRAAVLLCERPCKGGTLDYTFKGDSLTSKTKGPSLAALWGEGDFDPIKGYVFQAGQGLAVEHDRCLKNPAYTMYIKAALDDVSDWARLINSDGWGDAGFYVNQQFQSFPSADALKCEEMLVAGKVYQFVVTRDDAGEVAMYLNGWKCGAGKLPYANGYALDPAGVWFFKDTGTQESGGNVKRIHLWDKALTEDEVRVECSCSLPVAAAVCEHQNVLSPEYLDISYSSTWNRDPSGVGHGLGRLNSVQAWSPAAAKAGEFMIMDIGEVLSVAGVVTQGRNDWAQWVTSFQVQVSEDRSSWKQVECGRTFAGNTDQQTKVKTIFATPVKARYVRIVEQTWNAGGFPSMRAAVLICERPCVGAELDYRFQNTLLSRTKGPGLQMLWGDGKFVSSSEYRFENGQGFAIEEGRCIAGPAYTIYVKAKLDVTAGLRRLIGSDGWGESGIYINSQLQTFPESSQLKCNENIRPNTYYQFVVSRSDAGVFSLYLNGYKCATGSPPYESAYQLNPDLVTFFHDDSGQSSGGYIKRIHMWDEEKSFEDVASICGCTLPEEGDACDSTIKYNPMYSQMKFSSVWANEKPGVGHGRGRLNSPQGWSAGRNAVGEWFQIDTGEVQSIAGVVTQGRKEAWYAQFVTSFRLKISQDGSAWQDVECNRVFDGNTDVETKVDTMFDKPLKGRYIRIYPETWNHHMSMRAGVLICELPCEDGELDYKLQESFASATKGPSLDPYWGTGTFDAANGYRFGAGQGLMLDEFNCIPGPAYTIYMKVRLDQTSGYRRLINSEGWGDNGLYVNGQVMTFPLGGLKCSEQIRVGLYYQYVLSRNEDGEVTLYLNGYPCGREKLAYQDGYTLSEHSVSFLKDDGTEDASGYLKRIKMWDHALTDDEVATECNCVKTVKADKCDASVITNPEDSRFDYSSVWANQPKGVGHARGRLNSLQAWSAGRNDMNQWLVMDSGEKQVMTGVVTQGRYDYNQWVTSYKIQVSDDKGTWKDIECGRVFDGNSDRATLVTHEFDDPVEARYVKIIPQGWYGHISMRAAVMTCEKECKDGKLNYRFEGDFSSSTFGPMLQTPWGQGTFDTTNHWYRFGEGQGLQLDESACIGADTWTILVKAKLDKVDGLRQLIGSSDWDEDGFYVDRQFQMLPATDDMLCIENLRTSKWYYFVVSRSPTGAMSMYLNGYKCGTAEVSAHDAMKLTEDDVSFFKNGGSANTPGYVQQIRMWNEELDEDTVASACGCSLPKKAEEQCDSFMKLNQPYNKHTYSHVWGNYLPGVVYGQGQLDSQYGWVCSHARMGSQNDGCWMMIDTGEVQPVAGVVMQGRTCCSQWVTAIKVEVSTDGSAWKDVACGMIFEANTDMGTKVDVKFPEAVEARYVKIYPEEYNNWPSMRAGVIVCEKKCTDGELDYRLGTCGCLSSYTDGPMIEATWGMGTFDTNNQWYRFTAGQGLDLDEANCIGNEDWSILIEARMDIVNSWRKILGGPDWADDGLFVKDTLRFVPESVGLQCDEVMVTNKFYKMGLTGTKDGTLALYLNGWQCGEAETKFKDGYHLAIHEVDLFHGSAAQNTAGYLKRVRLWDKSLTADEMATASGCVLPEESDDDCASTVTVNVPYSSHRYSSTWDNQPKGQYWGQGRLNARYSWIAKQGTKQGLADGEWLQMDTGEVQNIAGVVTQGRGDAGWWTTGYSIRVSKDGSAWQDIACGMIFPGNKDMHTRVRTIFPGTVKARYVRIYPQTYYGWPSMRAGVLVCEKECKDGELDYKFDTSFTSDTGGPEISTPWGEGSFDSNNHWYKFAAGQGLQLDQASCVGTEEWSIVVEAKLDQITAWRQIIGSTAWATDGAYVNTNYQWLPAVAGMKCMEVLQTAKWYQFGLTRDKEGTLSMYLGGYKCGSGSPDFKDGYQLAEDNVFFLKGDTNAESASGYLKRIRMWSSALDEDAMATACGCSLPTESDKSSCKSVVMSPDYTALRASRAWANDKEGYRYNQGRLDSPDSLVFPSGFKLDRHDGDWFQLDTGEVQDIAGVMIQGRYWGNQFVKTFWVKISNDGSKWDDVECGRVFQGCRDSTSKVRVEFSVPLTGRYIRIYPDTYYNWASIRAGVLVCERDCKSQKLDYKLKGSFASSTYGPDLLEKWGAGRFDNTHGYRVDQGKGLDVDESTCLKEVNAWTAIVDAKLDVTTSMHQIIGSASWAEDGAYVNKNFKLTPESLECPGTILPNEIYKFGMTRSDEGEVSLFLNGFKCASGKPKFEDGYKLDPKDVNFMHSTLHQNSPRGWVTRVRLFGSALDQDEMAEECGCTLAETTDAECSDPAEYNPKYSRLRYSRTWANDAVGYRYGRGRLDSPEAWIPPGMNVGEDYFQIDLREAMDIAGVVTQGRYNYNQWVTGYFVKISEDGKEWVQVECGRIFVGNTDRLSRATAMFTTPIKARYVRIFPKTWYSWPSMRAGLMMCDSDFSDEKPSNWFVRMFQINDQPYVMPDVSTLTFVGKGLCPFINFRTSGDINKCIPNLPEENFAMTIQGEVEIQTEGKYTFCTTSKDGSHLKVDGKQVVDNGGVHVAVEKCGELADLKAGKHKIYVDVFAGSSDFMLEATYSGPDTEDSKEPLPTGQWEMHVYADDEAITKMPDVSTLTPIGEEITVPQIKFEDIDDLRRFVPNVPDELLAMQFWGTFEIDMEGDYTFCTISDDGSRLWIDGELAVNNGGLHGDRRYCKRMHMDEGKHESRGDFFQGRGPFSCIVTYNGPDTDGHDVNMRSDGVEDEPDMPKPSQWLMRLYHSTASDQLRDMPYLGDKNLQYLGEAVVPAIDFFNLDQLKRWFPNAVNDNIAAEFYGKVKIKTAGNYWFCTKSDDGSQLWLDGDHVVNNGGLHGLRQYCAYKPNFPAGTHMIKANFFQGLGGWGMQLNYRGPDTDNGHIPIPSVSAAGPPAAGNSKWEMRVYKCNTAPTLLPDVSTLQPVGDAVIPFVDFNGISKFQQYIPTLPAYNIAVVFSGRTKIVKTGLYEVCTESDDGSRLWIDTNMIVSNGGLHGRVTKCVNVMLTEGEHTIDSDFFNSGGPLWMEATYKGPDTDGEERLLPAEKWKMKAYSSSSTLSVNPADVDSLTQIGSEVVVPAINFHNVDDFRKYVPGMPTYNFAVMFYGELEIITPGSYIFCTNSDDGSDLLVDGEVVVDNDGLHGAREKCGTTTLKAGNAAVQMELFDGPGWVTMQAFYSGPDTFGVKVLIPSVDAEAPPPEEPSKWTMRLFASDETLTEMPQLSWLTPLGEAIVPAIDFRHNHDLDKYMAEVPDYNVAGVWYGQTEIKKTGSYSFCTESADGSRLYVDDKLIVDNGGRHGARKVCGIVRGLSAGFHKIKVTWWHSSYTVMIRAMFSGPDSRGKEVLIGSDKQWAPSAVVPSQWTVKVYEANYALSTTPATEDGLTYEGEGILPYLNIDHYNDLRKIVPSSPARRIVYDITGKVKVSKAGKYTICLNSHDGSKLWVTDELLIDNDGKHPAKEVCAFKDLTSGNHEVHVKGFTDDYSIRLELQWAGPETANRKEYMNSVGYLDTEPEPEEEEKDPDAEKADDEEDAEEDSGEPEEEAKKATGTEQLVGRYPGQSALVARRSGQPELVRKAFDKLGDLTGQMSKVRRMLAARQAQRQHLERISRGTEEKRGNWFMQWADSGH